MRTERWSGLSLFLYKLGDFKGLDKGVTEILIKKGYIKDVVKYLNSFDIDYLRLINRGIELGAFDIGYLVENINNFNQDGKNCINNMRNRLNYNYITDIARS